MDRKKYTGVGLVGNEHISSIYTVDNGIVDINGTGIYHLFYKDYHHDLMQSATTMIKVEDTLYYGNKVWKEYTHPHHIKPYQTKVEEGFKYVDCFDLKEHELEKTDKVYAYGENRLVFELNIKNKGIEPRTISLYGYGAIRNEEPIKGELQKGKYPVIQTGNAWIGMVVKNAKEHYMVPDSPTDFAYQTFLDILERKEQKELLQTKCRVGVAQGIEIILKPGEVYRFSWSLLFADSMEMLLSEIAGFENEEVQESAKRYWKNWILEGTEIPQNQFYDATLQNLIAIKAVCINGYIPADLTGHYFCNKMPCYYARDSIMVARAFLKSGHLRECRDIISYLSKRERKGNGEFYQRYDGLGKPNEGANNDVSHQIDSIGYFCRLVFEFYEASGEIMVSESFLAKLIDVIAVSEKKHGMAGPEGGVNEGVFGGAFITSSNMFIYGGLKAAKELFAFWGNTDYQKKADILCQEIYEGIQSTYNERLGRYDYGYVTYGEQLVRKYDTPQYFGPLYGYPNDEKMQQTHKFFLKFASFFENGIGYSEQEYHHGPWLFNTLACAQYCKIFGYAKEYERKMCWAAAHSNAYGLLPEAVDANEEEICFINPLSWACAQFVAASYEKGGEANE